MRGVIGIIREIREGLLETMREALKVLDGARLGGRLQLSTRSW